MRATRYQLTEIINFIDSMKSEVGHGAMTISRTDKDYTSTINCVPLTWETIALGGFNFHNTEEEFYQQYRELLTANTGITDQEEIDSQVKEAKEQLFSWTIQFNNHTSSIKTIAQEALSTLRSPENCDEQAALSEEQSTALKDHLDKLETLGHEIDDSKNKFLPATLNIQAAPWQEKIAELRTMGSIGTKIMINDYEQAMSQATLKINYEQSMLLVTLENKLRTAGEITPYSVWTDISSSKTFKLAQQDVAKAQEDMNAYNSSTTEDDKYHIEPYKIFERNQHQVASSMSCPRLTTITRSDIGKQFSAREIAIIKKGIETESFSIKEQESIQTIKTNLQDIKLILANDIPTLSKYGLTHMRDLFNNQKYDELKSLKDSVTPSAQIEQIKQIKQKILSIIQTAKQHLNIPFFLGIIAIIDERFPMFLPKNTQTEEPDQDKKLKSCLKSPSQTKNTNKNRKVSFNDNVEILSCSNNSSISSVSMFAKEREESNTQKGDQSNSHRIRWRFFNSIKQRVEDYITKQSKIDGGYFTQAEVVAHYKKDENSALLQAYKTSTSSENHDKNEEHPLFFEECKQWGEHLKGTINVGRDRIITDRKTKKKREKNPNNTLVKPEDEKVRTKAQEVRKAFKKMQELIRVEENDFSMIAFDGAVGDLEDALECKGNKQAGFPPPPGVRMVLTWHKQYGAHE